MTNEAPPTLDDAKLKPFVLQYSDLSFEKIIGSGANGDVYIGTHIPTKKRVAIKRLHDSETIMQNDLPFRREIYTLSVIKNPFLLPFVGFTKTTPFCIVTKFIPGGSLYINLRKENEEEETKKTKISLKSKSKTNSNYLNSTDLTIIGLCIAKGMKYLHKINIIHRDLKTQNILLDEKKYPIICDFGTSRRFDVLSNSKPAMTGQCGTANYMAPEFIKNESYDQSVDVYSYGVILWEMLTRETPYGGKDAPQVLYLILSNHMLEIPEDTPENLKKLILSCWNVNPQHRPTFSQIVKMFNNGEVYFEGTNRKQFEKVVQSFSDERKGRRPRPKSSSCEYTQTPVLTYIPNSSVNNNNNNSNSNNNNNGNSNNVNNGIRNLNAMKKGTKTRNYEQFDFEDNCDAIDDANEEEEDVTSDSKLAAYVKMQMQQPQQQQRPKIPKTAILNNEQRKNIAFRRHIAQLTTLYIRGIETGTDQQIRNSIAFIESHALDPALAKVEIWPRLLPVICNSISSKPGILPALQNLSLRLAESPAVLATISSVQELHRFLRPETFDLFLYVVNFVPQAVTLQMIKTLFTYSLPSQQTAQQQNQMPQNLLVQQSNLSKPSSAFPTQHNYNNNRFSLSPKSSDELWQAFSDSGNSNPIGYNNGRGNIKINYAVGGFGSFRVNTANREKVSEEAENESTEDAPCKPNENSNNNNSNNNMSKTSGPSSMQVMSSRLPVTEKATILLCLIYGQFQNNYEINKHIVQFFVENAVNFVNVPGGHLVLRILLNNGLVTENMFSAFSRSVIPENIIALYSCIFSINSYTPPSLSLLNQKQKSHSKKASYVPSYFTLTQILEHMLSIYPRLRNCAYEFIYRHGDHAVNKPLLAITDTLLKSIMMYHPNGTEKAILLLCRIACDSSSNKILLQENIAVQWMMKMSPTTAPPLMRLFVILFKDEKLKYRLISLPRNESVPSPPPTNPKHIHKYFENIAASNSGYDIKRIGNDPFDIKLNRMSAIFLSNVVKNGDNQAFLTVCWVISQCLLENEFVSILEDCEINKIIAEKFNATKNLFALRVICNALIQISKGFLTYDSTKKNQKKEIENLKTAKTKIQRTSYNNNYHNSVPNDRVNELLIKNSSSDFSLNSSNANIMNSSSFTSDSVSNLFSLSTSSPSFNSFDNNEIESSSLILNQNVDDQVEFIPVLKKCSESFNKMVLTCLRLIAERNEALKECILLLTYLSKFKETHDTLIKANCIGVLSGLGKSGEFVQNIKTIIGQLKASGCISNF